MTLTGEFVIPQNLAPSAFSRAQNHLQRCELLFQTRTAISSLQRSSEATRQGAQLIQRSPRSIRVWTDTRVSPSMLKLASQTTKEIPVNWNLTLKEKIYLCTFFFWCFQMPESMEASFGALDEDITKNPLYTEFPNKPSSTKPLMHTTSDTSALGIQAWIVFIIHCQFSM